MKDETVHADSLTITHTDTCTPDTLSHTLTHTHTHTHNGKGKNYVTIEGYKKYVDG